MEVEFEPVDVSMLYETAVEEIALEGLDGITLQGLCERMTYRENAPIAKVETPKVLESLWDCLKQDVRLRFYVLSQRRPILQIWNRNDFHDPKGHVEEPPDAPEEIYTHRSIEVRDFEAISARRRAKHQLKLGRNKALTPDEIRRINIGAQNSGEIVLEGISFSNLSPPPPVTSDATSSLKNTKGKGLPNNNPGPKSKKQQQQNDKKKKNVAVTPTKEKKRVKCSRVDDGGGVSIVAIRGSCPEYDTRVDITDRLRSMDLSYAQAIDTLGNRLVIVASQLFRESLLFQSSNQIEINGVQYCIVERVGRTRYIGEQARGKISLTVMGIEAKNLFYLRKVLLSDGIISKQPLVMRFGESRTGTLISVFHLPHFFSRQEHPEALKIRKIFAYVCNAPNNFVDYFKIQGVFGKYMMRTLVDEYKDFVRVEEVPFAVMYPEELEKEKSSKRKAFLTKKKIRIVTLRQPGLSLRDLIQKQFSKQESSSLLGEDDDADGGGGGGGGGELGCGEDGEDATFDWSNCYVPEKELAHESELSQLLRLLVSRGGWGLKQQDLSDEMSLTSLDARSAFRYLTRWKITKSHMEDIGRTKATCLTYFKCEPIEKTKFDQDESSLDNVIVSGDDEGNRLLQLMTAVDPLLAADGDEKTDTKPTKPMRPFVFKSKKTLPPPTPSSMDSMLGEEGEGGQAGTDGSDPKPKVKKERKKKTKNPPINGEGPPKPNKKSKGAKSTSEDGPPSKSKKSKLPGKGPKANPASKRKGPLPPLPPLLPLEFLDVSHPQKGRKVQKRVAAEMDDPELPPPLVKRKRPRDPLVDFIDVEAANKRDRQRADWTPEEDLAVLYLFIASVIFIPRYNLDKVFVYNAVQMRDILHRKLPETKTKTSGVVRRRVHGLLKSKTLYSKYRTMLHKALRDEELYTTLIEPHLPPPSISIFLKGPDHAVEAVMNYLANKFDSNKDSEMVASSSNDINTKSSNNDDGDLETLLDSRELRRMETIWTDIWANVFHGYYRTKKILTAIVPLQPEAVQELQSEGIVIEEQGPKWALPYAPPKPVGPIDPDKPCIYSDEQFEFAYDVATTLVSTADKVMNEEAPSSSSSSDDDEDKQDGNGGVNKQHYAAGTGTIALQMKGEGGHVPDLSAGERNPASSLEVFGWTCRSVFMSVLLGGGGSSESLRAFMAPIPDTTLSRLANSLRGRGVFTMLKTSRRLILTNTMKRKLTNFVHPTTFRSAHSLLTSLKHNHKASFSQISLQNIGAAYSLGEIGPLVRINCSLPSCIITVKEEWRDDYELILASQQDSSTEQGREEIALRLLRFRLNADTLKSRLVEKDFFDINLPVIQLTLKDNIPTSLQSDVFSSVEEVAAEKLMLEAKLLQTVELDEKLTGMLLDLGKFEGLHKLINITEDIGISVPFLLKHFGRKELRAGLDHLLENRYIYFVGVRHRKIVTSRHMDKWSIYVPGNVGEDGLPSNPKRVVSRPWIDSVGKVNWKLIDRVIVGLLGQLHRHSHLYIQRLAQSLSPLFSVVEVLVLVTALKELRIVDIFKFRQVKPGRFFNLFSKWNELDREEDDDLESPMKDYSIDLILDLEQAWVELMPFDVTKYSRIQSIILPQDKVAAEEEDDVYQRFDPEDVEIMVHHDDQDEEEEEEEDDDNENVIMDEDIQVLP